MSLIGVTASGSSPEVIPLRPSQEAAGSVPSTIFRLIGPRPSWLSDVDLGRDPRRLGAGADDQQVGLAHHGSAITSPLRSGLKEIALLRIRSARLSTGRRSTSEKTVRSTRFISISA